MSKISGCEGNQYVIALSGSSLTDNNVICTLRCTVFLQSSITVYKRTEFDVQQLYSVL